MSQQIHKQLEQLRQISPDPRFAARVRLSVLSRKQNISYIDAAISFVRKPIVIGSFALALALFVFISVLSPAVSVSSLKDANTLNQEISDLSINIHLKELSYQQNADSMIMAAITEIKDTKVSHLNQKTLNSESQGLNIENNNTKDINKLLDTVIF